MESQNHPLGRITNQGSLSMLEALIPFVEYPLKLPLALFIKFNEIKLIIQAFRSIDQLSSLGLNAPSSGPTDIICALTGMSPDMLNMLMSFTEGQNGPFSPEMLAGLSGQNGMDFSNLASMLGQFNASNAVNSSAMPDTAKSPNTNNTSAYDSSYSFDDAIKNILSEYDISQAENYTSNLSNDNTEISSNDLSYNYSENSTENLFHDNTEAEPENPSDNLFVPQ